MDYQEQQQQKQRELETERAKRLREEPIITNQDQYYEQEETSKEAAQVSHSTTRAFSYTMLKEILREKIHLSQKEQMELWTWYMPKIGLKN